MLLYIVVQLGETLCTGLGRLQIINQVSSGYR